MLKNLLFRSSNLGLAFRRRDFQTKSIRQLLDPPEELIQSKVRVVGWIKTFRDQKEVKFAQLNDGSDARNLQLVFLSDVFKQEKNDFAHLNFNTAVECQGVLVKSPHQKQNVELHVVNLNVIGPCDPNSYPFKPKAKYTLEQLRSHVHLRSHSSLFAELMKLRSQLTWNIHEYFHERGFTQVHTPIITSNNCEGGCETFRVNSNEAWKNPPENKEFFLRPAFLTASAQLHLETMTTTLGRVYTLSPAFRAEKSLTRHHLAEFYMLEAEAIDMRELDELLDLAEDFLKTVSVKTLSKAVAEKPTDNKALPHVQSLLDKLGSRKFHRISYSDALGILNSMAAKKKNLKPIKFGEDLNKEQEKLLLEHFEQTPVFVCRYPREIKPFYMRRAREDEKLVENFDLLVGGVGEVIGGSLREDRVDLLREAMGRQGVDAANFELYLDTKRFGAMKMGGFGLGLERLMQFLFEIENIRDTCAFPRIFNSLNF